MAESSERLGLDSALVYALSLQTRMLEGWSLGAEWTVKRRDSDVVLARMCAEQKRFMWSQTLSSLEDTKNYALLQQFVISTKSRDRRGGLRRSPGLFLAAFCSRPTAAELE